MSNRHDLTRRIEAARKQLAYSIAAEADAKGARAERRLARMGRIQRRQRLESLRWGDLHDLGEA